LCYSILAEGMTISYTGDNMCHLTTLIHVYLLSDSAMLHLHKKTVVKRMKPIYSYSRIRRFTFRSDLQLLHEKLQVCSGILFKLSDGMTVLSM